MNVSADKLSLLKLRSRFTGLIRLFFGNQGYLEVETPLLSPFLIPEPALEVFQTEYLNPYAAGCLGYLVPSPELWMKRLLACGTGNIFQICKCFRNAESLGKLHNPEFTMLEWYTVEADYLDSLRVLEQLMAYLAAAGFPLPDDVTLPLPRITMAQAFRELVKLDLAELFDYDNILKQAAVLGLAPIAGEEWEAVFNRIFVDRIEPELAQWGAVVVTDYPAAIPTLARAAADPHYAQRWELYIGGREIANCYTEETDYGKISTFLKQEQLRKSANLVQHRCDTGLAACFEPGFPACSGVALGVDRFFMSFLQVDRLSQVLAFPFSEIFELADG